MLEQESSPKSAPASTLRPRRRPKGQVDATASNSGPDPIAPNEQRRERDPGRRPYRGDAAVRIGERKPELRRAVIGRRDDDQPEDISAGPRPPDRVRRRLEEVGHRSPDQASGG